MSWKIFKGIYPYLIGDMEGLGSYQMNCCMAHDSLLTQIELNDFILCWQFKIYCD